MSNYLQRRNVSYELQMKINRYYQYVLTNASDSEGNDKLLSLLNSDLKKELTQDIYGRLLKKTKPFYLNFSAGVLKNLAQYIKEINFTPETMILERN